MNLHNSQKYVANLNAAMRHKGCVKRFEKCSAEKISLFSPTAILQLCKQSANLTRTAHDRPYDIIIKNCIKYLRILIVLLHLITRTINRVTSVFANQKTNCEVGKLTQTSSQL